MTLTWLNRRSDPILELQLSEGNEVLESLQLNPIQQSVRIRCEGYHQVFFLENSKAWQNQVVFTNAYGIEAGTLKFEHYPLLTGTLYLEEQQFRFSENRSSHTLSVYRTAAPEHTLVTDLPGQDNLPQGADASINQRLEMDATILLGICWNLLKTAEPVEASGSGSQLLSWLK